MITPTERIKIVAFTKGEEFRTLYGKTISFPYQRVVALWCNDGFLGQQIGERNTMGRDERVLSLSPVVGSRLMASFSAIIEGQEVNCHRFSREISGMQSSTAEPVLEFDDLPIVDHLPEGFLGIIGVVGYGVPHSIGYGLGDTSLQVMSSGGELGFADNDTVVEFYRQLYPHRTVNMHQAQITHPLSK